MIEIDTLTGLMALFGLIVIVGNIMLSITYQKPTDYSYSQKVKIRSGFYLGHTGYVVSRSGNKYMLQLDVPLSENKITEYWFNLELANKE